MRLIERYETDYEGKRSSRVLGLWKDATGNDNIVSFKNSWGREPHVFSDEEVEALLEGKEITLGSITGHLQYRTLDSGKKYLGFCPNFDEEYNKEPVFDPNVGSRYEIDRRNETKMNQFMRLYYYSRLINADGTKVEPEFISDKARQTQGIDVIYSRDNRKYVIDEKAQLDYIYSERPLPTFVLELLNSSSGRRGWFINDELKTEYYMFIWPHADIQHKDKQLRSVDDIQYADYALVESTYLKSEIERQYHQSADRLMEYALRLSEGTLEGAYEEYNKRYFKRHPFDNNAYLVYTMPPTDGTNGNGKTEGPVNLVVKRELIEKAAEETGILRRNDNETNGDIN